MTYAVDAVLDRIEGPPTLATVLIGAEIDATTERLRRAFEPFLYSGQWREFVEPWRCPDATLWRRLKYGGRKGRRAERRLIARGLHWTPPADYD